MRHVVFLSHSPTFNETFNGTGTLRWSFPAAFPRRISARWSSEESNCAPSQGDIREVLSEMERGFDYLERGGPTGRGTYWTLRPDLHATLAAPGHPERDRRIDWEAAKTRVLSVLRQRAKRGERGLSNGEIRRITRFERKQVERLMSQLMEESAEILHEPPTGRSARYRYEDKK